MNKNLISLIAIISFMLTFLIAYKVMIQGEFPWFFLFLLLVVSLIGLYVFGPTFFQRTTATEPSLLVRLIVNTCKGSCIGLLGIILYDYFVRHTLRWETYSGLLIGQLFVVFIGFSLIRRTI
ncbi:MAG: hypothetical protein NT075_36535 [Chloroflexi bacterium]|nr:hypothetical protein [Chloroflexota bacterium]